jgi:UDPglucose 6-dehydrogenase
MSSLEVAVIGAGYVGLSTAAALSLCGHTVRVVERNSARLAMLHAGRVPIAEPHLEGALFGGAVSFGADLGEVVRASNVVIIAVGTPPTPSHGADLSQVYAALEGVAAHLGAKQAVIAVKSTVPVGTHADLRATLERLAPDANAVLVSNPEFLRQGRAVRDAVFPDRIVVGANAPWAFACMKALYGALLEGSVTVPDDLERQRPKALPAWLEVSPHSAELAKYAANAFLAMKISFVNEIANVCAQVHADIDEVVGVLGGDARIGADFLRAGLGYGGSCFPKDTRALSQIAVKSGYDFRLLRAVIEVNAMQRYRVLDTLERDLGGLRGKTVTVLGLTFKPDTDDLRESLGVDIALELAARGARVHAHDPVAALGARRVLPDEITVTDNLERALDSADAAVLVTEWRAYLDADWASLGARMRTRVVLDGRNALHSARLTAAGFRYLGVGRAAPPPTD